MRLKFLPPWKRPLQELNNVGNTLRTHSRVASRTAQSYQKSNMTGNAVADGTKARQVDEKTLFKNGRQRIIQVGRLCKSPKLLDDLGSLRREAEKIGKNPEAFLYAILKV
jgi:hypothetical protein